MIGQTREAKRCRLPATAERPLVMAAWQAGTQTAGRPMIGLGRCSGLDSGLLSARCSHPKSCTPVGRPSRPRVHCPVRWPLSWCLSTATATPTATATVCAPFPSALHPADTHNLLYPIYSPVRCALCSASLHLPLPLPFPPPCSSVAPRSRPPRRPSSRLPTCFCTALAPRPPPLNRHSLTATHLHPPLAWSLRLLLPPRVPRSSCRIPTLSNPLIAAHLPQPLRPSDPSPAPAPLLPPLCTAFPLRAIAPRRCLSCPCTPSLCTSAELRVSTYSTCTFAAPPRAASQKLAHARALLLPSFCWRPLLLP